MTTVAIMQPTYLGWLGYYDMLDQADVFVLLDTVAVSPKSWQTRNRIRAKDGNVVWLSVPTNARRGMPLNEVLIRNEHGWQQKHLRTMQMAYGHSNYVITWANPPTEKLADLNEWLIHYLAAILGIHTRIVRASTLARQRHNPYHRLADICQSVGATELLNTAGAREWLDGHDIGVPVRYHQYEHPVYDQGGAPFMSHLSVVDLLSWHGPDSLDIIRSGRQ